MLGLDEHEPYDRSRTERSNERKAYETKLATVAKQLVAMSSRQLGKLQLPEEVLDAVDEARRIKSRHALGRQLRVVRRSIRETEPEAIVEAVDDLLNPSGFPTLAARQAAKWTDRLVAERDAGISAFVEERPEGNRQQLRSLLRNLEKAPAESPAATKARRSLQQTLEGVIAAHDSASPDEGTD